MLRILYAGSPEQSAVVLEHLSSHEAEGKYHIVGVLTNPPSCKGRSGKLCPTPVQAVAEMRGIPVFAPEHLGSHERDVIEPLHADLLVCFAYGRIFGPKFMALFPLGGINLHPSLLPRYRGCAPVPAAILNRDSETGVSVQKIAQKMDSGNILRQIKIPLSGTETASSLLDESARIGAGLLYDIITQAAVEKVLPEGSVQDESSASYSKMLCREDGIINWKSSAVELDAKIRAFWPWPGACTVVNGIQLKILSCSIYTGDSFCGAEKMPGTVLGTEKNSGILVQTGDGVLAISRLQLQAKKAVFWKDFINGAHNFVGCVLGSTTNTENGGMV